MINNTIKIISTVCLIIITYFTSLFLYNNSEINRFKYYQGTFRADQYIIDSKNGRVFRLVCAKFAKDKNGKEDHLNCENNVFELILTLDYDKYLEQVINNGDS